MRRSFALATEPHTAEIGDVELQFQPEIAADEFLDAYERVREASQAASAPESVTTDQLRDANRAVREFLGELMLPASAQVFAEMRLPSRVYAELLEWVLELYGGGASSERPTGSSSASAPPSRRAGTSGRGALPSKGSTRGRGR